MRLGPLVVCATLAACGCGSPRYDFDRRHVDGVASAPCLFWESRSITWHLDAPGVAEADAVTRAFATWQLTADTCSDLRFVAGAGITDENLVVWRERRCDGVVPAGDACFSRHDCGQTYDCWELDAATLAVTTVTYSRSTGKLLDADIQMNSADQLFTTLDSPRCPKGAPAPTCVANDVQNTVTHELGHLLGLDHVSTNGSTMSATAGLGDLTKRTIDPGTVEGFCTIYPRGAPTPSCL